MKTKKLKAKYKRALAALRYAAAAEIDALRYAAAAEIIRRASREAQEIVMRACVEHHTPRQEQAAPPHPTE